MNKKRVTSQYIADKLGVSRGTVYRALNDKGRINEQTKRKILELAKALNYTPNRQARALVMERSLNLAIVVPGYPEYFFNEIQKGAVEAAASARREWGAEIKIRLLRTGFANDALKQIAALDKLRQTECDGIILAPANPVLLRDSIDATAQKCPVVVINSDAAGSRRLCYIGENSRVAGRTAAELMGKFIREGEVAVMEGFLNAAHLKDRLEGFLSVIERDYPRVKVVSTLNYSEDRTKAYDMTARLLRDYKSLKGIFVTTAAGLIPVGRAVSDAGKAGKLSVIGFDCGDDAKELLQKDALSAVVFQDQRAQGYYAVKILSAYLTDGITPEKDRLYTRAGIMLKETGDSEDYLLYKY